uniref:Protocadherin Fat 4-like n=1 Tax=Saccoglossus kowalevskii TaxID=10224 RepID=A0ABM0MBP4_SACKO|nr:PREDICTED: protocadherin Fat 4-like [Saccoglossus kowalevskii]
MDDAVTIQIPDGMADGDVIYSPIEGRGGGKEAIYWYSFGAIVPDLSPDPYPFKLIQDPTPSKENEAQLVAVVPPGFDTIHEYVVDLVLEDLNDNKYFTCTLTLQVTLSLYVDAPYNATIGEHATVPQTIANITATDADGQANDVTFIIIDSNPKDAPFQIGPVTAYQDTSVAELQNVNLPGFDYETGTNVYELFITVSDTSGGDVVKTATVTVYILDELEPMIITNLPDSITISESVLGSVFIVEWDPPREPIWMLSTSPVNGPFSINATGSVNVVSPGLNYKQHTSYDVTIFIGDEEGFTDNKVLHVTLLPNLGPEITNLNDTIQISEMSAGGTDIFVVQAVDNEGDDFYCVMFANPNDGNFGYNSSTNSIYVINSPILNFETVDEYTLSVTCHDLGVTNTKPGTPKVLTVQITDENEAPILTNLPATVKVPEDALNSVSIFQADGYDVDGNSLSFSLTIVSPVSGQGKFAVADSNGNDGTVSISNNPAFDFEDVQQYSLVLEATDGEFTATGTLTVDIMDVAEPPVFVNDNQDVYIDEEQIVGTLISLDWTVTDVDDVLTDLTYNMIAGTYSPYFSLTDGTNPELRIAQVMDYEASFPVPFPIMFTVTDPAGKKDYLTVNVYLQNIYDNAPIFTQIVYSADVFDGESQGSPVLQGLATDVDLFDIITYSIEPANTYFVIDSQLGEVTVNQPINSSISGDIINFTLVATDLGSNQDTAFVQVTVASVNKIHVIIDSNERPYWNWEVPYDLTNDTYVNNVVTNNQIFEKSGSIIYKLYMPNTRFRITTDGQVFVAGKLMAEEEYILMYYVEDDRIPPIKAGVSMIRIDTYIPQMVLVNIHLGISVADFTSSRQTAFISALNKRYKPWKYRISSIRSDTTVSTRKLLQNTAIVVVYALKNDLTNSQDSVDSTKEFVYFVDLAEAMQIDSDGTPVALLTGTDFDEFPVESVKPTYELINTHNSYSWWLDTPEGNVTIAILILLVIIVIVSICCCCWFIIRKKARSDKQEITSRADVDKSGENNLNNSSIVHILEDKKLIEKDGMITDQSELQKNVGDSLDEKDADNNGIKKDLVESDVPVVEKAGVKKLIEKDKLSRDQSKLKSGVGDNLDEKNVDKNGIKKDSNDASVTKKAGVTKQNKKLKDKDNLSSDQSKLKNGVGDNLDVKNVDKNGIKKDSNKSSVVHKAGDTNLNEKKKLSSDQSKLKQSSGVKDDTRTSDSASKKEFTSLSQMKYTNQKTGKDATVEHNSLAIEKDGTLVNTLSAPENNNRKDSVIGPLPDMSKQNETKPRKLKKGLSTRSLVSNKNLTSKVRRPRDDKDNFSISSRVTEKFKPEGLKWF